MCRVGYSFSVESDVAFHSLLEQTTVSDSVDSGVTHCL